MVYGIFRLIAPIGASRALNLKKFGFLKTFYPGKWSCRVGN
jgi:hypothetical protein